MSKRAKSGPGGGHGGGAASDVSDFLVKNGWKVMSFRGGKANKNNGR